jgi:hypothetical protein
VLNVAIKQFWLSGAWVRPPVSQTVTVSDLTKAADSVRTTVAFIRSLTDAVKSTDLHVSKASFIRALADSSKATDRFERRAVFIRSLTDSSKVADRAVSIAAFIKALHDASKLTDAIGKTASYIRSITETAHAFDALAKAASYIRALTDIGRAADTLAKELSLAISDIYKAADQTTRATVKTLEDLARASDLFEKTASLVLLLAEIIKAIERVEKVVFIKPRPQVPYTLRYGLTFEQWVVRRAERIRRALEMFYTSNAPVDVQVLAERVYRERLGRVSKLSWMPVKGVLTDFRPSPFIKSFLSFLVDRLILDGYVDPRTMRVIRVPSVDYLRGLVGA